MSARTRLLVVLAVLACTGVVPPVDAKDIRSGAKGNVYVTGCAGPQDYEDPQDCTSPYQATIRVLTDDRDRHVVKTFRTRSDGSFKVHLRPARYILDPLPADPHSYPVPVRRYRVTVKRNKFAYVRIYYTRGLY